MTDSIEKMYNFMGKRHLASIFSIILIIASIASLSLKSLNFGLDFTGGTLIEVEYSESIELNNLRKQLAEVGFGNAIVQHFGTAKDVVIRVAPRADKNQQSLAEAIVDAIDDTPFEITVKRVEFIGPQVGEELREQGGLALLMALAIVLVYVAFRFQYKFSVGAVSALAHDVIITLGFFSFFQWEFDLTVLAALLAVIGYSLNDTIVVFDRIRENFRKLRNTQPINVINISMTQVLGRTIATSLTTLLVLFALYFVGGELIQNFALALIIGIGFGTYSSIYIAANIILGLKINKQDLMLPEKEGDTADTPETPYL